MKAFLALLLLLSPVVLFAQLQKAPTAAVYTDAQARYRISYPAGWQLRKNENGAEATFSSGYAAGTGRPAPAVVTFTVTPLPDRLKEARLTTRSWQDTVWRNIRRLPQYQVLRLAQRDSGRYDEVNYDYTYASATAAAGRLHVLGRQVWRGGYEFRIEYRAETSQDARFAAEGRQLVESFAFTGKAVPSRRYADQVCDDKMYGIAATRYRDGQWEDDCRTIHEFSTRDVTAGVVVHRSALPFQSYALTKGFDNALYAVTKAPTNRPEPVYRYDPATRQGRFTAWQLPAQGADNCWISAATDDKGCLYFLSSDANQLVRVSPYDNTVTTLWTTDPARRAPYYPLIGFDGAGTHGNFCFDDANTLYQVYSTDGSLIKINLTNRTPAPNLMALTGLPKRGGYSDLLMQNDESGRRRLYLAGPKGLYKVDLARQKASYVRKGTYTDLAGCNLFRVLPRPVPVPPAPTTALFRGRVIDATTGKPLPNAQLRFETATTRSAPLLSLTGVFFFAAKAGMAYSYHAEMTGYIATDSVWAPTYGPCVQDIALRPLAVGTTVPMANVQFEQSKAVLLPTSFATLDKLVRLLIDNPRMTIELRGHTDNVGPPEKNVVLSAQRVGAVKVYLVEHGVDEARIAGIGLGGASPMASNEQEATRRLNRRVEFRITAIR